MIFEVSIKTSISTVYKTGFIIFSLLLLPNKLVLCQIIPCLETNSYFESKIGYTALDSGTIYSRINLLESFIRSDSSLVMSENFEEMACLYSYLYKVQKDSGYLLKAIKVYEQSISDQSYNPRIITNLCNLYNQFGCCDSVNPHYSQRE